ncbi:Uncharacterised protein [Bordetella pertussis]|nr:Uncharacterised protein [Bordetella pertussis]
MSPMPPCASRMSTVAGMLPLVLRRRIFPPWEAMDSIAWSK